MQTRNLAIAGFLVLALVTITAGLLVVGGPETARMEQRDDIRLEDITKLSGYLQCLHYSDALTSVPAALPTAPNCNGDPGRRNDPFTGQPYRYERKGSLQYQLCADYELPELVASRNQWNDDLDRVTGCLTGDF